jgi:hypothetical protein
MPPRPALSHWSAIAAILGLYGLAVALTRAINSDLTLLPYLLPIVLTLRTLGHRAAFVSSPIASLAWLTLRQPPATPSWPTPWDLIALSLFFGLLTLMASGHLVTLALLGRAVVSGELIATEVVLVISSHDATDNPSPEPFRGGTNHPVEPPTSALREGIGRYLLPRLGLPFPPPPDPSRQRQLRTQQHSRSPRPAGSGRSARFSPARPSQWRSCGGGAVPRSRQTYRQHRFRPAAAAAAVASIARERSRPLPAS